MAVATKKKATRPKGLKLPRRITAKWLERLGDCGEGRRIIELMTDGGDSLRLTVANVRRFLASAYSRRAGWIVRKADKSFMRKYAPKESGYDRKRKVQVYRGCTCDQCTGRDASAEAANWLLRQARLAEGKK